jgi:hypothetical protein
VAVFALFCAILTYEAGSFLYYFIGRRFGGRGSLSRIRSGSFTNALLAIPLTPFSILRSAAHGWLGFHLDLVYILFSIWFIVVTLHVYAAAHCFSLPRALTSIALCILSAGVSMILVLVVYFVVSSPPR